MPFLQKASIVILLYIITFFSIFQYQIILAEYKPAEKDLNNEIRQLNEKLKANNEEINKLNDILEDYKKIIDIKII
ncbi:MAG: hypothetical protein SVZ03_08765 [Spirochaetota bacterium]|nr:hypothetical protein [Spirochaetota bacterium]